MVGFIKGLGNLFTMITQGLLVTWQNLKVVWSQSHINCVKMTLKYLPPSSLLHLKMNTIMNVQFLLTRKRINSYLYMLQVIFWIFFLKKLFVVSTPLNHLDLDDCKNFEVTDEVSVWIHNGADALCLSHFYFDIFDIKTAKFNGELFSCIVYAYITKCIVDYRFLFINLSMQVWQGYCLEKCWYQWNFIVMFCLKYFNQLFGIAFFVIDEKNIVIQIWIRAIYTYMHYTVYLI